MVEAKPRQSNMRSEGLFFRGRDQYTIFLHSRSESQLSFSAAARKLALSGRSTENIFSSLRTQSGNFASAALN